MAVNLNFRKKDWKTGEVIKEVFLDNIEEGIEEAHTAIKKLDSDLEHITTKQREQNTVYSRKTIRPLLTFVDDDGNRNAVLSKLKMLSEKHNVPFTVCVPSDFIGTTGTLTLQELKDLQNINGFEIASHSKTHAVINDTLTLEQQKEEIYGSYRDMTKMGLDINTIVYPYGQSTVYAKQLVSQYYKCGVSTDARINSTPLITTRLGRFEFGGDTNNTYEFYKSKLDQAIANNEWLIFMTHVGMSSFDTTQLTHMDNLIAYAKQQGVDVVTVKDGINIRGNVIDINENQLYVGADGTNNIKDYDYQSLDTLTGNEVINFSTLPNQFTKKKVVINAITKDVANSPTGGRGILKTTVAENDNITTIQEFEGSNRVFRRVSIANNTMWGVWKEVCVTQLVGTFTIPTFVIPAGKSITKTVTTTITDFSKFLLINPTFSYTNDLIFSYGQRGSFDGIKINFYNPTTADITLTDSTWKYIYL